MPYELDGGLANGRHAAQQSCTIEYIAPFDKCDRERDYDVVWAVFEQCFKQ